VRTLFCGRRAALALLVAGFLGVAWGGWEVYKDVSGVLQNGWGKAAVQALKFAPIGEDARKADAARREIEKTLMPYLARRLRAAAPKLGVGAFLLLLGATVWSRRGEYCILWGRNPYRGKPGFVIGSAPGGLVRVPPKHHALVLAPSGSGKSVTLAHGLLEWPGSAIVVDPKGELASLTSAYRREALGHDVAVWDPLTPTHPIPLTQLYGGYVPALKRLASLYRAQQGRGGDSAFITPWETALSALLLDAEHRKERFVWGAAAAVSPTDWREALEEIAHEQGNPGARLARDALVVVEKGERYFASIVGSTMELSELLRRAAPAFDAAIESPRLEAATIYITLHDNKPEQTLFANWLLGGLYEALKSIELGPLGLMWVLDEVGVLRPPLLPDMVRIGRGRGQGVIAASQSMADLHAAYGADDARALVGALNGPVAVLDMHQADAATSNFVAERLAGYTVVLPQRRDSREARDFLSRAEAAAEAAARLSRGVMFPRERLGPVPIGPAPYFKSPTVKKRAGGLAPRGLITQGEVSARPLRGAGGVEGDSFSIADL